MPRKCKGSWVENYAQRLESVTGSPLSYHYWTALTLIGATLKRHVWYDRVVYKVLPNLYTVLVGRPAIGKGVAFDSGLPLIKEAKTAHILSDRLTMEYVLEKLSKGFPTHVATPQGLKFGTEASVLLVSRELSVFITASQFALTALTDLWEGREGKFMYGTRGRGEWPVESPCISLLGASAQEYLIKTIPADAIGGGFTRRVNFVFEKDPPRKVAFPERNGLQGFYDDLAEDLKEIGKLRGEMKLTPGAKKMFEKYYNESEPAVFDDQATSHYKSSRWSNAIKVAMCLSASEGDTLIINEKHWTQAEKLVDRVTEDIKMVFRAVGESDLTVAADKTLEFIEKRGFASKQEMLRYLWRDVTKDDLEKILTTFREAGILSEKVVGNNILYSVITPTKP